MSRRRDSYGAAPPPTAGHIREAAGEENQQKKRQSESNFHHHLTVHHRPPHKLIAQIHPKKFETFSIQILCLPRITSITMKKNAGILLVILTAVVYLAPVDAQRTTTVTRTTTSTITDTVTYLSNVVCAKLVNVTGVCRRRRGLPIDEPVILTFDDQLEEAVDQAFYQALHPGQFAPARTLGVEVTPLVLLPVMTHSDDYYVTHPLQPGALNAVQPSMERPRYSGRNNKMNADQSDSPAESRIYFAQIAAIANAFANVFRPAVTVTKTVTAITTRVSTSTKFSTNSFFIMGCTPKPFPFSVCAGKRSDDISSSSPV